MEKEEEDELTCKMTLLFKQISLLPPWYFTSYNAQKSQSKEMRNQYKEQTKRRNLRKVKRKNSKRVNRESFLSYCPSFCVISFCSWCPTSFSFSFSFCSEFRKIKLQRQSEILCGLIETRESGLRKIKIGKALILQEVHQLALHLIEQQKRKEEQEVFLL